MLSRLLICAFTTLLFASIARSAETAQVISFSPEGTVRTIRQVKVQFSLPMVPLGKPDTLAPFSETCKVSGQGKWLDSQTWIYDFVRDLPRGTECKFTLKKDLHALGGVALEGKREFAFKTGIPVIQNIVPYEGSHIEEEQVFVVHFDGVVKREDIAKKLSIAVDGIENKIPFNFLTDKDIQALLQLPSIKRYRREFGKSAFVLRPMQNFPPDTAVRLKWADDERTFEYQVRGLLKAEFSCERENKNAPCNPITQSYLKFSEEIPLAFLKDIRLKGPGGKSLAPVDLNDQNSRQSASIIHFPNPLDAGTKYSIEIPKNLKDVNDRMLANASAFPLQIKTAPFPPLVKFAANFGILETANPVLPVTVRAVEPLLKLNVLNVKSIKAPNESTSDFISFLNSVLDNSRAESPHNASVLNGKDQNAQASQLPLPGHGKDFEVMGIPLKGPGLYIVEIESPVLGKSLIGEERPMFISTAVLVTNLAVHFKQARERSLVWVTELSSGKPVLGAEVSISNCQGRVLASGHTDNSGIMYATGISREKDTCDKGYHFIVTAQKGDDRSLVLDNWDQGIEAYRFNLPINYSGDNDIFSHEIAHAILARSLLRAGDTLNIKHVLRNQSADGFTFPLGNQIPGAVAIRHMGSDETYKFDLKFSANGTALTDWLVPKAAKLGEYQIFYLQDKSSEVSWNSTSGGTFRVEEFKVPTLKATIQSGSIPLVQPKEVGLDFTLQYLSGGGASKEKVVVRYQFANSIPVQFADYSEFSFAQKKLTEGRRRSHEEDEQDESGDEGDAESGGRHEYRTLPLVLDQNGTTHTVVTPTKKFHGQGELAVEMEYRDPTGTVDTVARKFPIWSSDYLVGLKPDSWSATKDSVKIQAIVVDLQGHPLAGIRVQIDQLSRTYFSYRKKVVGGFYAYDSSVEVKRLGSFCDGKTDIHGLLICNRPVAKAGEILLQARVKDSKGRETYSNREISVYDKQQLWFDMSNNDRIDLLLDAKSVEPGGMAKIQVRTPFQQSTALVTVEREGVLDAFVTELKGENPEIQVPIKGSYAPNAFVSVMSVRGRVDEPKATAIVDLGRPSFKLGIQRLNVGWGAHELKVKAETDKAVYQTREKAKLSLVVTPPPGETLPKDTEVAVAVVDQALLELLPNHSVELLRAMMRERSYEIRTATSSLNVIGKRHFGKKALPSGGGGGRGTTRELFDTLLLWQGRVHVDSQGHAQVDIPLNDSISKFSVAVVATAGSQLFGSTEASFTTTKDLQIIAGLPQILRVGDQINLHAAVRNTTSQPHDMRISLETSTGDEDKAGSKNANEQNIKVGAQSSQDVSWPFSVPNGIEGLRIRIRAESSEPGAKLKDDVQVTVPVLPAIPVRTIQATLIRLTPEIKVPVVAPKGALVGQGGVTVAFKAKLAASLDPVMRFMREYPYSCLEQQTSRAVVLNDQKMWNETLASLPSYIDNQGLLKYWPSMSHGSVALTSYVLAISNEMGWKIPDDLSKRLLDGLRSFMDGTTHEVNGAGADNRERQLTKITALEAISRYLSDDSNLIGSIQLTPQTWPTSSILDWRAILSRWKSVPGQASLVAEADQILRARLDLRGTRLSFSTEKTDYRSEFMISPDLNAARLLIAAISDPVWQGDVAKIVNGSMARSRNGTWYNTTANAWNAVALRKYSAAFEPEIVSGITEAGIENQKKWLDWTTNPSGGAVNLNWPTQQTTLNLIHRGSGQLWATIEMRAAIPMSAAQANGLKIKKEWQAVQRKTANVWSRGDIVRMRLTVEAQADQPWVVVQDPTPAGAVILGSGLGRDSSMLAGQHSKGEAWLAFSENAADSYRAYYQYMPKGITVIEYTVRLNQSGTFQLPPSHVEAMYSPDIAGDAPNLPLEVKE